ncbi:hypothetical protein Poli38472_014596 [Pythium oligandrum]|uniref:ATP-dependent DNA helicase n=1 Tax=Pythium oligandrum TaxID=41045 RepID=A0A8K1CQ15_PYTOL|nr:hypothetical protein Poli38472_014596 [Pythium oligandrum]|eukprot:TMW66620.1 hypothetical protein Poli38472_014596 [Pythium oligandrum]
MEDQLIAEFGQLVLQRPTTIEFTNEQEDFIERAVKNRQNLLLVAPAGYGKSAVIKEIVNRFNNERVLCALCASTGKAALLVGGRTLHSYLGIGQGNGSVEDWVKFTRSMPYMRNKLSELKTVQVILADEVSMVSAKFLDQISEYLQKIRSDPKPFGGVQIILIGDLCQLPPVKGKFIFFSAEYERAAFHPYQFTRCFRQSDDPKFIELLNEVRFGRYSEETWKTLSNRTSIDPEYSNGLTPMRIVSRNDEVDKINEAELNDFLAKQKVAKIKYAVRNIDDPKKVKKATDYRKKANIPEFVEIAVGCQVVVTQNLGQGIVNGSQGYVTTTGSNWVQLRLHDGSTARIEYVQFKDPELPHMITLFSYMPLRLGYASTVHKAQGMTLKLLEVDLKNTFAHGQLYTALSRVTDLRGLTVKNLTPRAFICDKDVLEFYKRLS